MEKKLCVFLLLGFWNVQALKSSRIIGGQDAKAGQYPFSAAIYINTQTGRYFCGGALISNHWILTAGQCVNNAVFFTVHLGSNTLEQDDSNRKILASSRYVLHPDFNPDTLENDVGLIKLREPVMYNDYIQRILLAYDYTDDDTDLTAIGWGQTSDSNNALSEHLQYVTLAAIPNDDCVAVYGDQISDHMICVAGQFNEGTCIGDTGSPLLDNDPVSRSLRHVGIASFISGNGCESTDPSGYTKTYSFREWIRNVTSL
ncbi:brachyurin [Tribolium castaneum]|uniref:Serine protease 3-like Protein n=2 Tax=Tribolium castaneum TaxID=7070 RepID=A0A139WHN5_TRICA|nr:PREDICTED: brachyurin-like [Tribolium castaneum]KYB27508.1 Serine protease 3-like Protein [Tribolium castaneum]|eukprot:XP_008199344.1 PREDICTED: brachyurin-like [Tribolium castaneum]